MNVREIHSLLKQEQWWVVGFLCTCERAFHHPVWLLGDWLVSVCVRVLHPCREGGGGVLGG